MAKEFAKQFYNSTAWKKCRKAYIVSVHGLCERCGKVGHIVHHKEKLTPKNINDPDVTLNFNKLEYVCLDCHNEDELNEHNNKYNPSIYHYKFDENGNMIQIK